MMRISELRKDQMCIASFYCCLSYFIFIIQAHAYPGRYTNKIFVNVVNKLIFTDEKKLAKRYPEYFDNGMPLILLAMIATMVCAHHLFLFQAELYLFS